MGTTIERERSLPIVSFSAVITDTACGDVFFRVITRVIDSMAFTFVRRVNRTDNDYWEMKKSKYTV